MPSQKAIIIFLLISGMLAACTTYYEVQEFRFFVLDTGENLSGKVFLDERLIGHAENGSLNVNVSELHPGIITLNGKYEDVKFNFEWELFAEDIDPYWVLEFFVNDADVNELLFDPSLMNTKEIEWGVYDRINYARCQDNIPQLKRNDILDTVARNYSQRMFNEGFFFAH